MFGTGHGCTLPFLPKSCHLYAFLPRWVQSEWFDLYFQVASWWEERWPWYHDSIWNPSHKVTSLATSGAHGPQCHYSKEPLSLSLWFLSPWTSWYVSISYWYRIFKHGRTNKPQHTYCNPVREQRIHLSTIINTSKRISNLGQQANNFHTIFIESNVSICSNLSHHFGNKLYLLFLPSFFAISYLSPKTEAHISLVILMSCARYTQSRSFAELVSQLQEENLDHLEPLASPFHKNLGGLDGHIAR